MEREGLQAWQRRARDVAGRHGAMLLLLPIVWWFATQQHYLGHAWGDDFALYVRQARSIFNGNIGQVIADNRFNVDNAAKPGFSPYVYPWGWPLLLSPFVRLFGLDYARLKMVEIALLCGFLWVFHEILRTRLQRWMAFGVVASIGTTLAYLVHTDQLLSELPYMLAIATTFWWLDRCRRVHDRLHAASRNDLIVLGLLAVFVFNVRREGLAMIAAIVVAQLLDVRGQWRVADKLRLATPLATFVAGVVGFQLLLPSALAPDYPNAGLSQTWKKLQGPFRTTFASQLGLPRLRGIGLLLVFLLVVAGIVIRMWRAPRTDAPWLVFALGSLTIAGMIPAVAGRYMLAITPFGLYFAVQALAAIPITRRIRSWLAIGLLVSLVSYHLHDVEKQVGQMRDLRARGAALADGPEAPYAVAGFAAIRHFTHEGDVIAFFKVRALTLYTNRRGVQSSELPVIQRRADFYLMRKVSGVPQISADDGRTMGWTVTWEDPSWVLWRVRQPIG